MMTSHLDDIQTALRSLKKIRKKYKEICMTNLGLAESFKTMNWPGQTVTLFDGLFLGKVKRYGRKNLTQTSFKSTICAIKIWDRYL